MRIRNKLTGQIFDVVSGTLYPDFFEEVTDDEIKVGEPTVEFEIEETKEEVVEEKPKTTPKKAKAKKTTKKTTKGAKKNATSKK